MTAAERREKITAEIVARTGITEPLIERLVREFYEKVRTDAVLAPIFEARIQDWEPHLERMFAFWSSVALMSGRYHGTPMAKHMPLPVDADHFDRWLALFEETARRGLSPGSRSAFRRAGAADRRQPRTRHRRIGRASCSATAKGFGVSKSEQEMSDEASSTGRSRNRQRYQAGQEPANPFSGSSLVPMLIIGIVLVLVGMIAAVMCELIASRPAAARP